MLHQQAARHRTYRLMQLDVVKIVDFPLGHLKAPAPGFGQGRARGYHFAVIEIIAPLSLAKSCRAGHPGNLIVQFVSDFSSFPGKRPSISRKSSPHLLSARIMLTGW